MEYYSFHYVSFIVCEMIKSLLLNYFTNFVLSDQLVKKTYSKSYNTHNNTIKKKKKEDKMAPWSFFFSV